MTAARKAAQQAALAVAARADLARRTRLDEQLRSWRGVSFAILAADLGMPECLVKARARQLGIGERSGATA